MDVDNNIKNVVLYLSIIIFLQYDHYFDTTQKSSYVSGPKPVPKHILHLAGKSSNMFYIKIWYSVYIKVNYDRKSVQSVMDF